MTDRWGSMTLNMTTALTRAGTLSLVMTSCGGMVRVTSRRSTRINLSIDREQGGSPARQPGGACRAGRRYRSRTRAARGPRHALQARDDGEDARPRSIIDPDHGCSSVALGSKTVPPGRVPVVARGSRRCGRRPRVGSCGRCSGNPAGSCAGVPQRQAGQQLPRAPATRQSTSHSSGCRVAIRVTGAGAPRAGATEQAMPRWKRPASECGHGSTSRMISRPCVRGRARVLDRAAVAHDRAGPVLARPCCRVERVRPQPLVLRADPGIVIRVVAEGAGPPTGRGCDARWPRSRPYATMTRNAA